MVSASIGNTALGSKEITFAHNETDDFIAVVILSVIILMVMLPLLIDLRRRQKSRSNKILQLD